MSLKVLNVENQAYIQQELLNNNSWMSYQIGDIFKRSDLNMILHQTNCFHSMNTGYGYQIRENYLNAAIADKKTLYGDSSKLGTFSTSLEVNKNSGKDLLIVNLYSQFHPGTCEDNIDAIDSKENRLAYLHEALTKFAEFLTIYTMDLTAENKCKFIVGVPWLIGCNSIDGDYNKTFEIFKQVFNGMSDHVKIVFVDING